MENYRTTRTGFPIFMRPVKISDEPLLKDFFYSLSDQSLYRRFISVRKDMPHERLQEFVIIDYTKEMVILATARDAEIEKVAAVGQYGINGQTHSAEVSLVVRDDYPEQGDRHDPAFVFDLLSQTRRPDGFYGRGFGGEPAHAPPFRKNGF